MKRWTIAFVIAFLFCGLTWAGDEAPESMEMVFAKKYLNMPVKHEATKRTMDILIDGKIGLEILVDRNSVEIFGNNGSMYMPIGQILPEDNKSIELFTKGGKTRVENVEVCELNSVWK